MELLKDLWYREQSTNCMEGKRVYRFPYRISDNINIQKCRFR